MKALIFAAGLGTRLRPLTDNRPKALVEINGTTLLEIVIQRLKAAGVTDLIVNVHHHAQMIIDFLQSKNNFEINISISDEREKLLDTGGGLLKMANFFSDGNPFFVHNVDILSNIDLKKMYDTHIKSNAVASLSTRHRATSRYLLFNKKNKLFGWMNIKTGKMILCKKRKGKLNLRAFSGIHIISPDIFDAMPDNKNAFSIIDVYLAAAAYQKIVEYPHDTDIWMDVGKIENIDQAKKVLKEILVTE
ncbi:MAG: nucleotidyltransferase family protein [Saprospiraceae bacterium]|nr:nucleotidyltransferase family protein [Saprospiraceae bacterium]MDG2417974.1 nucleotidyltransferase family protein [Saprospiraceae bacterium]